MNPLQSLVASRIFQTRMAGLADYAKTLERLLTSETASIYAREALFVIAQRARGDEHIDEEPSDELQGLRDDFPSILRGSLFLYVVSCFENQSRVVINAKLISAPLGKCDSLKTIAAALADHLPGTIDSATTKRLHEYKYLRDACAHTGGGITSVLYDLHKVSRAAQSLPGVVFRPHAENTAETRAAFTRTQMSVGTAEFTNMFIPAAIAFFSDTFAKITTARPPSVK